MATIALAPDPNSPSVPCIHILADGEIIATVYYEDGDTSDGSPPRGAAAWFMFRNEEGDQHHELNTVAEPIAEEDPIQVALRILAAEDALRSRGIGFAASFEALPWEVVGHPNAADEIVGGLYRSELAGWLAAIRASS